MRWRLFSKGRLDGKRGIAMGIHPTHTAAISRRSFIALGGTAAVATGVGFTLSRLADAAEIKPAENPGIQADDAKTHDTMSAAVTSLRVEGDQFFIDGDNEGTRFFNGHLSVMADTANERFVVHFYKPSGEASVAELGRPDQAIEVHGEVETLTVDGIAGEGNLTIAEDAHVDILGVGSIATADLMGGADLFIITGDADAKLAGTSEVGILVLGNRLCDAHIDDGAKLAEVRGLGLAQLDGPGAQSVPFTGVDED